MKKLFITLLISVFCFPAYASPTTDKLKELVYVPAQLSGDFTQEKAVGDVNVTLKSSGKFAVDKTQGILWQVEKPVANTVIIQDGKLCMKNDADSQTLDSEDNQTLKHIISIMQSLLVQDYDALEQYFDITYYKTNKHIKIVLKTTDQTLSKVFTVIEIIVTKYADEVFLYNPEDDLTHIRFSNVVETAGEFSCEQ